MKSVFGVQLVAPFVHQIGQRKQAAQGPQCGFKILQCLDDGARVMQHGVGRTLGHHLGYGGGHVATDGVGHSQLAGAYAQYPAVTGIARHMKAQVVCVAPGDVVGVEQERIGFVVFGDMPNRVWRWAGVCALFYTTCRHMVHPIERKLLHQRCLLVGAKANQTQI